MSKTVLAFLAFLLLISLSQALRTNSHQDVADPSSKNCSKDFCPIPAENMTDYSLQYAIQDVIQQTKELNSQSKLTKAEYQKDEDLGGTLYSLTFDTNGK